VLDAQVLAPIHASGGQFKRVGCSTSRGSLQLLGQDSVEINS